MRFAITRSGSPVAVAVSLLVASVSAGASPQRQVVHFPAEDGFTIYGDYYAPANADHPAPIVILLHMYRSDRSAWKPLIPALHNAGFAILAIDLRGHGDSATAPTREAVMNRDTRTFEEMYKDVWGAYTWLSGQPNVDRSRFALVGASVGCSVALRYAAFDRSVDAVVCMTPGTDYLGLDSRVDIRQIEGRKLLLLATADERKAVDELAEIGHGVDKKIFDGRAHGTRTFGVVGGVEKEIADYLRKAVDGPSGPPVFASVRSHGNVYHEQGSGWIAKMTRENIRVFSSAQEAEARGLRKARNNGPHDRKP